MKRIRVVFFCLAVFLTSVQFQGCVVETKSTIIAPQIVTMFKGTFNVDPYLKDHTPLTVAVLPFRDISESKEGSAAVRKGFYNHFSSLPFKDRELYLIDDLLSKAGLTDIETLYKTSPQELGRILNVDAVVFGEISDFDKLFAVMYSNVAVGAEIRMYDARTNHFLWSGKHTVRIHEGGVSVSPIGIIATIVATSMNVRDVQLLRACDDLFRDMVKTIPAPSLAEALRPPVITLLTQDTKGLPRKAGDEIKVVIQGTPKMRASFDIGDYKRRIDMQEIEPGGYLGVYKARPEDNVSRAMITGYLVDDSGNTAQWVDASGTVTMDTIPPDTPKHLKAVGRSGLVALEWDKSAAPDLIGYKVYQSITPLTGFTEAGRSELTQYSARELDNGRKYYFQISAVDLAGNESERTEAVAGVPVAPGPTPVSGPIESDTVWYAGASPYVIEGVVTVRDKASLLVEPGTEIRSAGPGIIVEGRLEAQGDSGHIVIFDGIEGKMWNGLSFLNVKDKDNAVRHARISHAAVGILCDSSSPRIEESEFVENETAIRIAGAFSKPEVSGNTIHKQKKAAVVIESGALPVLTGNRIEDNDEEGLLVRSASPVVIRNAIVRNRKSGVTLSTSSASLLENSIFDNQPLDMISDMSGEAVNAKGNWWGTEKGLEILKKIAGRIDIATALNAPYPDGKSIPLPILAQSLGGTITGDGFLTLSNSPYRVVKDVIVDGGATLYIEPGVEIQYDQNTSLVMMDGGIIARGTPERPINFTAAGATPTPGFYANAIRFARPTQVNSALAYAVIRFASTAIDIYAGNPDISNCLIAENSQSGIFCRNDAAPKIIYNTFKANAGEGAVKCVGMSNPVVHRNNFTGNAVAIQTFSSIYIDARENWWGSSPPDANTIWGDQEKNINIKPWLEQPDDKAFDNSNL